MEQEPLLDLSLMYSIFDTYREKVLAGCPDGFDLYVDVSVGGRLTIVHMVDPIWMSFSGAGSSKNSLVLGLIQRLRVDGWGVSLKVETTT